MYAYKKAKKSTRTSLWLWRCCSLWTAHGHGQTGSGLFCAMELVVDEHGKGEWCKYLLCCEHVLRVLITIHYELVIMSIYSVRQYEWVSFYFLVHHAVVEFGHMDRQMLTLPCINCLLPARNGPKLGQKILGGL
jgi:hypothetical protein